MVQESTSGRSLTLYFVIAFGMTWGLALFAKPGVLPFEVPEALATASAILLHYGPLVAALVMVGVGGGRAALAEFGRGFLRWKVGVFWWVFIFVFPLVLRLATLGIEVALGGTFPPLMKAADVPDGNPILLIPIVFLIVFFQAGLAEEPGWRGYAVVGLQQRWNAVTSSVVLGLIWAAWHFHPVNFASLWPIAPWYVLNIIPVAILLTWVFNNTGRSILMAALFHTASNVSDWILPVVPNLGGTVSIRPFVIQGLLACAVALVVILRYGPKTLTKDAPTR